MRWCRFRHDGSVSFGILDGEEICVVDGDPIAGSRSTVRSVPLAAVQLLAPVVPATFYCVGYNYRAHVRQAQGKGGSPVAEASRPEVGYRAVSALIGHGQEIVRPADCPGRLEAEGELVAVVGRRLRRCTRSEAEESLFGWTIGNDVSARDWQHRDRTLWRAKNSDTFKPMGPWIETDAQPLAPTTRTTVAVDGKTVVEFATGDMIFDPYDYITEIARYITLHPGDVIWMGTDGTVELPTGGTVAVSITGLGTLSNPIVSDTQHAFEETTP